MEFSIGRIRLLLDTARTKLTTIYDDCGKHGYHGDDFVGATALTALLTAAARRGAQGEDKDEPQEHDDEGGDQQPQEMSQVDLVGLENVSLEQFFHLKPSAVNSLFKFQPETLKTVS